MPPKAWEFPRDFWAWVWRSTPEPGCVVQIMPAGYRRFEWEGKVYNFRMDTAVHILNHIEVRVAYSTRIQLFRGANLSKQSSSWQLLLFLVAAFPKVFLDSAFSKATSLWQLPRGGNRFGWDGLSPVGRQREFGPHDRLG